MLVSMNTKAVFTLCFLDWLADAGVALGDSVPECGVLCKQEDKEAGCQ